MNILVVDDATLSRKLIIKRFPAEIKETATIIQGENGREAIDLYKKHRPDVVFMDLTMPVMDGYEALKEIMAYDSNARIYVVTADIQAKAKERVLASGAMAIEAKPINEDRLAQIFAGLETS